MGSKSKGSGGGNNKDKKKYGMGPGQSMAMAGNTGLATASENQANAISKGLQNLGRDSSFSSIGQNIGEVGSKYRRPANVEGYARKMDMINQGFANEKPARTFVGPDGRERINFLGTGLKDDQGRTILSMMNPELTASQPTFNQVFGIRDGDIRRALTGYNSIKYDEPGVATSPVSMVNTPGLIEKGILSPGLAIGKALLNALPSFKNQTQETLPSYYGREGYIPSYQRSDPSSDEDISVIENLDSIVEQISNSTRPTYAATGDTYPSNNRPTYAATGDTLNFVDPFSGTGQSMIEDSQSRIPSNNRPTYAATGYTLDDRPTGPATGYTYPSNTRPTNPATGYTLNTRPTNAATGDISSIPSMPIFSGQMFKGEDEPYKTSTQKIADMLGVGNNISSENSESSEGEAFDPDDPFANLTDPDDLRRLDYFRNAGFPDDYILDYFQKMNYLAYGGSVAPQSGPMSNGIGTLYNTR